jgi:serine/threonine protein kinase
MGEVYRAHDTRLNRTVALKILAGDPASTDTARARFEREARAVASVTHPNICALYDVGTQNGLDFLVMEYLQGETLAARLQKGPLPPAQALRYGVQIAQALDRAHMHGLVHRDLKPANIMLTKDGAKVLDFGLAKAYAALEESGSVLVTRTEALTSEGTLLGTLPYMSPEQLEGKKADPRSDIFSFGTVLYEMVTGKRPFGGESSASLISSILTVTPPLVSTAQPASPAALDHVIQRCLEKDPDERWQTGRDLAAELKWVGQFGAAGLTSQKDPARVNRALAVALACAGVVIAILAILWSTSRPEPPSRKVGLELSLPEGTSADIFEPPVVSPDGSHVIVITPSDRKETSLWVRPIGSFSYRLIARVRSAFSSFWSADGSQIGFISNGQLKTVSASGGEPRTLCPASLTGASWNRSGTILFTPKLNTALYRIDVGGNNDSSAVTKLDTAAGEREHGAPHFLPDGKHFLFLVLSNRAESTGIYMGSLDSTLKKFIVSSPVGAMYVDPGVLVFLRAGSLMAQPFDWKLGKLSGEARVIVESVQNFSTGYLPGAAFSVSRNGVLAFRPASPERQHLVWFDRKGTRISTLGEPGDYTNPALSRDGRKVAIGRVSSEKGTRDIWVFDLARNTELRLTSDPTDEFNPAWSPDGSEIAFSSERKGPRDVYITSAVRLAEPRLLFESPQHKSVEDWSPHGRLVLFNMGGEMWGVPPSGGTRLEPVVRGAFEQSQGKLSGDGKWIAYRSNESGRYEVYAERVPSSGEKTRISTGGGSEPFWRADGRELFYLNGATFMSVEIQTTPSGLAAGKPAELFTAPIIKEQRRNRYVVTADGTRFLAILASQEPSNTAMRVLLNWMADLKR